MAIDRSYLPPKTKGKAPSKEGDLLIWRYEAGGRPYAIVFPKTGGKPLWHLAFTSEEARERHIEHTKMQHRVANRFASV